uniref:Uncharacterized protein n=1 Tax=Crocodylus porosus TaxID=8502 RepID=A0A7M4FU49_CROPO
MRTADRNSALAVDHTHCLQDPSLAPEQLPALPVLLGMVSHYHSVVAGGVSMETSPSHVGRGSMRATYKFEHIPVKYIVIGEALPIGIIWLVIKTQRTAEIQVCSKLSCNKRNLAYQSSLDLEWCLTARDCKVCACTVCWVRFPAPHSQTAGSAACAWCGNGLC